MALRDLLLQNLTVLGVVRHPLEHGVEVAGLLAGRDRRAVDLGEDRRECRKALGQRAAFHHPRAHAGDHAAHPRLLALLRDREQRFLERDAGTHQGRKLAGQEREIGGPDAVAE